MARVVVAAAVGSTARTHDRMLLAAHRAIERHFCRVTRVFVAVDDAVSRAITRDQYSLQHAKPASGHLRVGCRQREQVRIRCGARIVLSRCFHVDKLTLCFLAISLLDKIEPEPAAKKKEPLLEALALSL